MRLVRDLTTGEVAKMLSVSTNSVIKWARLKMLPCYRVLDSKHRRFQPSAVHQFATDYGLPIFPFAPAYTKTRSS
jgi:excisionase family DNA binding protein